MINELIDFISEYFGISKENIKPDSEFVANLGLQSYSLIEMCCALEEQYGIEISEDDIVNIFTVRDLSCYIAEKKAE